MSCGCNYSIIASGNSCDCIVVFKSTDFIVQLFYVYGICISSARFHTMDLLIACSNISCCKTYCTIGIGCLHTTHCETCSVYVISIFNSDTFFCHSSIFGPFGCVNSASSHISVTTSYIATHSNSVFSNKSIFTIIIVTKVSGLHML